MSRTRSIATQMRLLWNSKALPTSADVARCVVQVNRPALSSTWIFVPYTRRYALCRTFLRYYLQQDFIGPPILNARAAVGCCASRNA